MHACLSLRAQDLSDDVANKGSVHMRDQSPCEKDVLSLGRCMSDVSSGITMSSRVRTFTLVREEPI